MTHDPLATDESEGNVEFGAILFMVDNCEDSAITLGHRLGILSTEEAERLAIEVKEVVDYESGNNPVTETETQPATQPATKQEG